MALVVASLVAIAWIALGAPSTSALTVSVKGNHLTKAGGAKLRLIGVNRSGSEYACAGDDGAGGHGFAVFQGPVNNRAIHTL